MPKTGNPNPLAPAETLADWEAQGWSSEPVEISAAPRLEATISIRFDPEGARLLRRAARLKGMTKSEFVRQATLQAAQKTVDEQPLPIMMWISRGQESRAETLSRDNSEQTIVWTSPHSAAPTATTRSTGPKVVVR
jgi:uncharacterized protein (DUF1778 family)